MLPFWHLARLLSKPLGRGHHWTSENSTQDKTTFIYKAMRSLQLNLDQRNLSYSQIYALKDYAKITHFKWREKQVVKSSRQPISK